MRYQFLLKFLVIITLICFGYYIFIITKAVNEDDKPLCYYYGNTQEKVVYLTFHDGPSENTLKILDILKNKNVKASFFLIGENVERFPNIVKRIVEGGHVVGNHTYTHRHLEELSNQEILNEILRTENVILKYAGIKPKFFAAPYLHTYTEALQRIYTISEGDGYININWSVDPEDWRNVGADYIIENIVKKTDKGSILLLHDGIEDDDLSKKKEQTVIALPEIIDRLRKKGFKFLDLDSLLAGKKL